MHACGYGCEHCTEVMTESKLLMECTIDLQHDSMRCAITHAKANMTSLTKQPAKLPRVRPAHCVACAL